MKPILSNPRYLLLYIALYTAGYMLGTKLRKRFITHEL
jgi:hypothetical protein